MLSAFASSLGLLLLHACNRRWNGIVCARPLSAVAEDLPRVPAQWHQQHRNPQSLQGWLARVEVVGGRIAKKEKTKAREK